jgi:peptidoglycan/LPS O-acetylase OafA/YrhL
MGTWRLVLAWLVVADHTTGLRDISTNIEIGRVAVTTFFFISGFLMPLTFDTHYRAYGFLAGSRKFYVNRFLRIYPIYWASLAVTMLAVLFYGPTLLEHATAFGDLSRIGTYLSNVLLLGLNQTRIWGGDFRFNPPAWTLDVELQYYILVPFILWAAAYFRRWAAVVLAALGGTSAYLLLRPAGLVEVDRSLLAWASFFLLGYVFYLSPTLQSLALRKRWIIPAIVVLALVARFSRSPNVAILSVTLACMIVSAYLLVLQQNRGFGALDRLLGDLSYPTYILHWICVQLIMYWLGDNFTRGGAVARFSTLLVLNVLISTLVAYASLRTIGEPIEMLRRKIRDGRAIRADPAESVVERRPNDARDPRAGS